MRRRAFAFFSAMLAATAALASGGAAPGSLLVRVRDARTGASLDARVQVELEGEAPAEVRVAPGEPASLKIQGQARLTAAARGHLPLAASFHPAGSEGIPVTFWLPPAGPAPAPACVEEGMGLIRGWLHDAVTLAPLEGARVYLERGAEEVSSGEDGGFELEYATPPSDAGDRPALGTLVIEAAGHAKLRISGIVLAGDTLSLTEDLEPGQGVQEKDIRPMPLREPEEQVRHQEPPLSEPAQPAAGNEALLRAVDINLVGMTPPASIRVGTTCSCTSCSSVSVYSLEDYVARGLDNEWISSWASHSLKSGSIPYRSYGAWYTAHPLNSNYDICSSTCCQAFDPAQYSASQTAANATAGFMLQQAGSLFRAEYSAENNCLQGSLSCTNGDLSCGNGYAGSPANNWPCLSDSVCAGQSCYGHGRGMCQWGTQRWASNQGKLWNWIENHYYNNSGSGSGLRTAYMTSPITMPSFSPSPATVGAGATFTIHVTAVNSSSLSHAQIMIGASLYSPSAGYISDPSHDAKVTLAPGTNSVSRQFTVPGGTAPGTYDLIVALWYDTNGDNAITGSDLALLSSTSSGAVTVVSCASDSTFDWKADFYSGTAFTGFIFSKSTPRPAGPGSWSDWGSASPYPGCVPADQFSVRWTKTLAFAGGTYRFLVGSDDGARLYVDGTKVLDAWTDRAYTEGTVDVPLAAGNHAIVMEFYENGGAAVARLDWWALPVAVPDGGSVQGQALGASRSAVDGSTIHLTWGTCASAAGYAVYYGNLADVGSASLSGASCSLGTSGSADWTGVPSGDLFFFVVSQDGRGDEGSWGTTSAGAERGGASASGFCGNIAKITGANCQ